MRTLATVVLLTFACTAAVAGPDDDAQKRDRLYRAMALVEELHLDETASGRLFPAVSRYLQDRERYSVELATVTELLGKTAEPAAIDRLLDRSLAAQRALIAIESKLVVTMRQILPAEKAARARVLLINPQPPALPVPQPQPQPLASHDRESLFPPKSPLVHCDPFAQMHRCPN